MAINYPNKPWTNNQVFSFLTSNGDAVTGTYNADKNAWTFSRQVDIESVRSPIFSNTEPTVHPDYVAPDNELIPGDIWFDTSDTDVERYIYNGTDWILYPEQDNSSDQVIFTSDVLTVPSGTSYSRLAELAEMDPLANVLENQEQVNDFIAKVSERAFRGLQRTTDNVDFIQNTVASGGFRREPKSPTPPFAGSCYMLQDGGAESVYFDEVQNLLIAKDGLGPYGTFENVKAGDTLAIQNDDNANFGVYVVVNATELPLAWDFGLKVAKNRAIGSATEIGKVCRVRVARPVYTLASDTPPQFSESGQLWYDTANDRLFVWDEEDGQFYDVGGEGGGVGNDSYLPLSGGTLTGPVNTKTNGYAFEVIRQDVLDQNGDPVDDVPLVTAYTGSSRSEFTYNKLPGQYTGDNIEVANVGWVKSYLLDNGGGGNINLDDYATLEYVDDTFLKLTGGTVTGTITAQGGIKTASIDGGASNLLLKKGGSAKISIEESGGILNGQFRLFVEGTEDSHLVTKKYVDDAVETGVGGIDLDDYATIVYSDAGDGAVLDEVLKELDRFREEIGLAEYSFNYTLREDNQGGQTQDGDCLIGDTDPEQNQMFILDDVQRDGTVLDHQLIQPGDEIIFEQDLGHKIVYEVIEVRDTADQVILSVNFLRYAGDNVRGFQQFAYDRLALIYKEGQLPDSGGGGNMDDYLPLAGGDMTGNINMARDTAIAGTSADGTKFANLRFDGGYVKYLGFKGDDAALATQGDIPDTSGFLPLTGGAVSGKLTANNLHSVSIDSGGTQNLIIKHNGAARLSVEADQIIANKPITLFAQGTANSHAVTKGYVDSVAGGGYTVPEWSWINVLWDGASSGQFGMIDRNNQSTSRFADCRGIWWKGTDRSGNKAFNDSGWVDWSGYFPGPLYIQRDGQNIFRVAQASGLNTWVMFDYVRDMDLYFIGWTEAGLGTALGGYTGVSNGGVYGLLIPELAF